MFLCLFLANRVAMHCFAHREAICSYIALGLRFEKVFTSMSDLGSQQVLVHVPCIFWLVSAVKHTGFIPMRKNS